MSSSSRILFAISDTGGGHRAGAAAIDAALEQLVGAAVERHTADILANTNFPLVRAAPDLYDQLSTRWLPVYDMLFHATDGRRRIDALTQTVYLRAHRSIVRILDETRPNLVVSVHPLVNRLIANTRRTYRLRFRFVTVVTDLVSLHAAWADPEVELCVVPTEEAYQRQIRNGLPASKLIRTGFPIHPKFANYRGTKREARAALDIAVEPFTILLTAGGVGSGNLSDVAQNIRASYPHAQLMIVTGKNTALRDELMARNLGTLTHVYGFVNNMEVLMAASDIIVTKAGPGTLMEALAMRRPVIVTAAVGVQEQGNIDFVLNHELGGFCPTSDRIVPAIADLMEPETYAATVNRLADAVPRDGAIQIATILLDQLELEPPVRRRRLALPDINDLRSFSARKLTLPARRMQIRIRNSPTRLRLAIRRRSRSNRWTRLPPRRRQ